MELDEIFSNAGFWLLGGGAVAATMIGYIYSVNNMDYALPIWQLIILIVVELIAAAVFSSQD